MIDANTLRSILKEIYGIDDKHLVPISTNWFVPTIEPSDKVGTWIGYRILSKQNLLRAYQSGVYMEKSIRVNFRLTFMGPQAEELADQTLLWEDRGDVIRAFGKYKAQINYKDRTMFSYPVRNGGFNDCMSWIVDMSAQTFYEVDTKQKPWFPRENQIGG